MTGICTGVGSFISYVFWMTNKNTIDALNTLTSDHSKTKEHHQGQLNMHDADIRKHGLELLHQKEISKRSEIEIKELLQSTSKRFDQVLELAVNGTGKRK